MIQIATFILSKLFYENTILNSSIIMYNLLKIRNGEHGCFHLKSIKKSKLN